MIHVHAPSTTAKDILTGDCADCKKHTRFLTFFTPWYGWSTTCLRCGRRWEDFEWMDLPFERFSRKNSIESAKRIWRAMPPVSENHFGIDE